MSKLTFSNFRLIVDGQTPVFADFKECEDEAYTDADCSYVVTCGKNNARFFWLHANFGKGLPYSEVVVNQRSGKVEKTCAERSRRN